MSDFQALSTPRARKTRRCLNCTRTIDVGERYSRWSGSWDGRMYTWWECEHCHAVARIYPSEVAGWDDDFHNSETFSCWEPSTVTQLRHKAQWRRRWRRADGALYPMPATERPNDLHHRDKGTRGDGR